jgi:hypothetical protein
MLSFVGFDRLGDRVTQCSANLTMKKNDGTADMVPCNGSGDFIINGAKSKSVNWWRAR